MSMASDINLTPEEQAEIDRVRRRRSIAIAVCLGGLAAIFYAVSMVKMFS